MAVPKVKELEELLLVTLAGEAMLGKALLFARVAHHSRYYKVTPKDLQVAWPAQLERAYQRLVEQQSIEVVRHAGLQQSLLKATGRSIQLPDAVRITDNGRKKLQSVDLFGDNEKLGKLTTPVGLETMVGHLLQKAGFTEVSVVGKSGDGGVDVSAEFAHPIWGGKYLIQCKHWQGKLPPTQVREFYGRICADNVTKGILICLGGFSNEAHRFAEPLKFRLTLMDAGELRILGRTYF